MEGDKLLVDFNNEVIVVTGCAGFIGGAFTKKLLSETLANVVGIDNLNSYYDVSLKQYRLQKIKEIATDRFFFINEDISDKRIVERLFDEYKPVAVVHLAAQAGVRYSIDNANAYVQSNIIGFFNMIESCRRFNEKNNNFLAHFLYASSSSVYGNNKKTPYSVDDKTDEPISFYAATKKSNELMAYSYSKLYEIPMTGLRFFTVYGPAGRPDMAYYKFTEKLLKGEKIRLYNFGKNKRDFTYIDDVTEAIIKILKKPPSIDDQGVRHRVYNVGNNSPVDVLSLIVVLSNALKKYNLVADDFDINKYIELVDPQPGDVDITFADIDPIINEFDIKPKTSIEEGIDRFVNWYREFNY